MLAKKVKEKEEKGKTEHTLVCAAGDDVDPDSEQGRTAASWKLREKHERKKTFRPDNAITRRIESALLPLTQSTLLNDYIPQSFLSHVILFSLSLHTALLVSLIPMA